MLSQDLLRARRGAPGSSCNAAGKTGIPSEVEHRTSTAAQTEKKRVSRETNITVAALTVPHAVLQKNRRVSTCSSVVIPCRRGLPSSTRCACVPPAPPPPLCTAADSTKNGVPQGPKRQKMKTPSISCQGTTLDWILTEGATRCCHSFHGGPDGGAAGASGGYYNVSQDGSGCPVSTRLRCLRFR